MTNTFDEVRTQSLEDEELRDRLVSLTRDLMTMPSIVTRPEDIERCIQFIANHVEGLPGMTLQREEHDGCPSLIALPEGVEKADLLMIGHLDVIAHERPGVYTSRIHEGRIHGPGAGDMKGEVAILLEIFHHFHRHHPGVSLGLVITSDEERGGMAGVRYLVDDLGLRCGAALIPDGGGLNAVTLEEKGILHLLVQTEGATAHAARPWLGANAVEIMMDALGALRRRFAEFDAANGESHWKPTCSVTIVRTRNRTTNRVPDDAEAIIDIRFPPPHTIATMLGEVRAILGPDFIAEPMVAAEPTNLRPDPVYGSIIEDVTGEPVNYIRENGGSDARFLAAHGIPVMISRPVVGNLHSIEEWIDIDSMVTFYRIYERYLETRLLGVDRVPSA